MHAARDVHAGDAFEHLRDVGQDAADRAGPHDGGVGA
jgi:hypothetical protein